MRFHGQATGEDRRHLRNLLFIQSNRTAQFLQCRIQRRGLRPGQFDDLLPLPRNWNALVGFGVLAELIGRLRRSSILVGDIFMEVASQEGMQRENWRQ